MKAIEEATADVSNALTGSVLGRGINIIALIYTYLWIFLGQSMGPLDWLNWLLKHFFGTSPTWLTSTLNAMGQADNGAVAYALVVVAAIVMVAHGTFHNRGNLYVLTFVTVLLLCSVQISGNLWGTYFKYLALTLIAVAFAFIRCWLLDGYSFWDAFKLLGGWLYLWLMGPAIHCGLFSVGLLVIGFNILGNHYWPVDSESRE